MVVYKQQKLSQTIVMFMYHEIYVINLSHQVHTQRNII